MMSIEEHIAIAEQKLSSIGETTRIDVAVSRAAIAEAHTNLARLKFETGLGS